MIITKAKKGFDLINLKRTYASASIDFYDVKKENTGYYTHYSNIEGKIFKIINIKIPTEYKNRKDYYDILLEDSQGILIHWLVQDLPNNTSVVLQAYLKKIKDKYLNKEYHIYKLNDLNNKYEWLALDYEDYQYKVIDGKINPYEITFYGGKNQLLTPYISFKYGEKIFGINVPNTLRQKEHLISPMQNVKNNQKLISIDNLVLESNYKQAKLKEAFELKAKQIQKELQDKKNKEAAIKEEKKRKAEIQKRAYEAAQWKQKLISKYGKENAKMILNGTVKLGWNKEMCKLSWGTPEDINTYKGSWGVKEQWVYGIGQYLYFDNGILTSIQN